MRAGYRAALWGRMRVSVDGREVTEPWAADPALLWGGWVYETLRTYGGVPFRLEAHLLRLAASAAWCGFPFDRDRLEAELGTAPGPGEWKLNLLVSATGHRVVRWEPLDAARVGAEVRVATRPARLDPRLPPRVKHTNRLAWTLAVQSAGVDEVLWEVEGAWTEATRSNVFVVREGVLRTPPDDGRILGGVTRDALLEVAAASGLEVRVEPVPAGPCDELWLSSTLKELAPVVELDGAPGPGGGPVGARLLAAFRATAPSSARRG